MRLPKYRLNRTARTLKINCKEKGERKVWDVNGPNMQSKQASKEGMTDHHDGSVSLHAWKQVDQTGEEIWPTNSS